MNTATKRTSEGPTKTEWKIYRGPMATTVTAPEAVLPWPAETELPGYWPSEPPTTLLETEEVRS